MPDYVKRMIDEQKELQKKIQKLRVFLNDEEKVKDLSDVELNLLNCQVCAMQTYDCILASRLCIECDKGNCTFDDLNS